MKTYYRNSKISNFDPEFQIQSISEIAAIEEHLAGQSYDEFRKITMKDLKSLSLISNSNFGIHNAY